MMERPKPSMPRKILEETVEVEEMGEKHWKMKRGKRKVTKEVSTGRWMSERKDRSQKIQKNK